MHVAKDENRIQGIRSCLVSTWRNSDRLQKLVCNILDISRIESYKLELKEYFNLNEKIKNVVKDIYIEDRNKLSSDSLPKDSNIDFEPSEDLIPVYADKIRIFEVISNFLTNVIKSFLMENPLPIQSTGFREMI